MTTKKSYDIKIKCGLFTKRNAKFIVSLLAMRKIVLPTRHISSSLRSGAVVKLWGRIMCTVRVNLE